ncbi:Uncharacterised protein [uncultured Clostridium sp.]|nr:Uncharacterised protein [uncultured Clostridium sp.]
MGDNKIRYLDHVFGEEDDIKKGNCYLVGTLLGDSLSINTLEFDVESDDSTLTQFKRNDPVIYEHNGKQIGIFYVQNIERIGATTYSFSAVSALGILAEGKHYGGIYTGQTVAEILPDICGTVPYEIKTNLTEIKLYGWLPIASPRDNLAQVLFAIGAVIKTDLGGVLRIESLWDGISGELTQNQMYEGPSVKYDSAVTQVVVTEHQYVEGGEETKLFEGTAQQGDIITFNSPMYELVADGFSILESGANYAKVSGGSGTLKGRAYIHNTREVVRDVSEAAEPNIKTVKDATLVSLVNSTAVAERLANYFQWTETIQAPIVYQGEVPGNRVATWHPYDKTGVTACLESADINLSNTLKADETLLVGFVPPKPETGYITERVVLTGSGTWKKPAGVTRIEYVLIGPGQGGRAGKKGEPGSATTLSFSYSVLGINTRYSGKHPGEGGKGGEGGAPGHGGKIYRGEMDLSVIDELEYSCGPGGTGATYDESNPEAEGNEGSATTLGDISSDLGSSSEFGYTDIITGEVYATTGLQGIAGGDGAGTTAEDRENSSNDGFYFTPSTGVTDEDGAFWAGGTTKTQGNTEPPKLTGDGDSISFNGSLGDGYAGAEVSYALGSGAAAGAAGIDGTALGRFTVSRNSSKTTITARAYATNGLKGADAAIVPKKALNGNGGRGGYGGGGGSSIGIAGTYSGSDGSPVGSYNLSSTTADPGEGGLPSQGGEGGDGLIILYYSVPKETQNGPIMDRTGRFILDKLGRRFVV